MIKKTIIEGSLEVKLPTIWRDEKQRREERKRERERQKKEDRKKIQVREMLGKSRSNVFFE